VPVQQMSAPQQSSGQNMVMDYPHQSI